MYFPMKNVALISSNLRFISTTIPILKRVPDPGIYLKEKEWQLEFHQRNMGTPKIHDKLPFKLKIKEGETYRWCACGYSHSQPLCDFSHANNQIKTQIRPVVFKAPKTTEVWLCNCKHTKNPPFCDGSHRKQEIQDAIRS